jgi:hypothetical protein
MNNGTPLKNHIRALLEELQSELEEAVERGDLDDFEYEAAYHAAEFIDSLINPQGWQGQEPLEDAQIALAALAAMRE